MQSEAQNLAIVFSGLRDRGKKETCAGKRVNGRRGAKVRRSVAGRAFIRTYA